jgi:NitT/TauT family transport system substrate-binding protein
MLRRSSTAGRTPTAIVGLFALLVAACSGTPTAVEPDGSGLDVEARSDDEWVQQGGPVVLVRTPFLGDAAIAIAIEEGWFEEAGLDIEIVEASSPADVFASVVSGDIDMSYFAPNGALFAAVASGAPVRVVAAASTLDPAGCDYLSIVGTEEAAARVASGDPEQLRGLRLAGSLRSLTAVRFVEAALAAWGTTPEAGLLELVSASNTDLTVLMGSDQIDLAVVYEPYATTLTESLGAVPVLGAPAVIPDELTSLYLFSERLLEDRELGARLLAVVLRGAAAYQAGPTEQNVRIVAGQTGIEPDLLARMCWATLDTDGRRYEVAVQAAQQTAIDRDELDALVPASLLWDHTFRDRALELLATMEGAS